MIDKIWAVVGGIVGVVLILFIIFEIVKINPEAYDNILLQNIETVLVLLIPTGAFALWALFKEEYN